MADPIRIVCPACASTNRIDAARISSHPGCGKCRLPLFRGMPVELTTPFFDLHLSVNDLPLLVAFWAPWCGPCKMMAPAYEKAAALLEPQVRFAKVDTETERVLGPRFTIRSLPTLVLFRHGTEAARQAGAIGTSDIIRWVTGLLSEPSPDDFLVNYQ
jgi:thioredoxin 2